MGYGEGFTDLGEFVGYDWQEFMHYLYLPVHLPNKGIGLEEIALPERLKFLVGPVYAAIDDAARTTEHLRDPYVYVTARRGFATPGNPLNRPGWHCDDFGGSDLNYIWTDAYPTQFLVAKEGTSLDIEEDDVTSMDTMARIAGWAGIPTYDPPIWIEEAPVNHLLRLTPWVVHNTPKIPAPGGMRSFFKISVSTHRYDLVGNSHNYLLDYDWPMLNRQTLRNQPTGGNRDYSQ